MALTATFKADFQDLFTKVQQAQEKLGGLSQGAITTGTSFDRMVNSFSGTRIVNEANAMVKVVDQLGGTSKLTAAELQKIGAIASEAAAKLTAMGQTVPPGIQKIADETKNANTHFKTMEDVAGDLGKALGGLFAVEKVTEFVKGLFEAADSLVKLSDKTGVSIETLQQFQIVGEDAGNTVDEITSAITKMENKLVGGDAKAIGAIAKLGLSFEDIQRLTPENQFIAISDAIRKIDDPAQQVNIAMALFGKAGAEILPTLKKGFDDLKNSSAVMSTATVKAFDDAGDAIKRWWIIAKGTTAEAIVAFVHLAQDGFNPQTHAVAELGREAEATAIQIDAMTKQAQRLLPPMKGLVPDDMAAKLAELNFDLDQSNKAMVKAAEEAQKNADAQAKYSAEVTKTVAADKNQVIALEALIPGLVAGTDQFNNVRDAIGGLLAKGLIVPDMLKNWYDANKKVLDVTKDFSGVMATLPDVISATSDTLNNLTSSANEFHDGITVAGDEITSVVIPAFTTLTKGVLPQMSDAIQKAGDTLDKTFGERVQGVLGDFSSILSHVHGSIAELADIAVHTGQAILKNLASGDLWGAIISGIGGVVTAFGKLFSNPEKQINPIREAFVQAAGGLDALNIKAHAAGVTLDALLNAKNAEEYQKAIDDLNKAFADQKAKIDADTAALGDLVKQANDLAGTLPPAVQDAIDKMITLASETGNTQNVLAGLAGVQQVSFKDMSAIAQKYGVDLQSLGPKFQAAKINDTAQGIINDFDTLQRGLGDTDEALTVLRKPINDLVNDSLKFGVAIPANMKPWVEQLEKTGQLTDENGDKITDLSKLKFSDPIVTEFDKIIAKLQELIDKIAISASNINNLPSKKTVEIVTIHTDVNGNDGDGGGPAMAARGGIVTSGGVQYLAGGGRVLAWPSRGSDTVPAMLTPGEGIVSRRGMASLGKSGLSAINRGGGWGGEGVSITNHFSIAADVDSPAARERVRKVVDQATMQALRRQKRTNVA